MALDRFFYPKSIAIIGASNNKFKAGYQVAYNMSRLGFKGKVFLVNPKETEIMGQPVYKSLLDIPEEVELIELTLPAKACLEVFEQAENRGDVKAAIVITSGFSETKIQENIELERKMLEIAHRAGIRVFGPNCVGVMNTDNHLDTTFAAEITQRPGGMSVISQSGSVGASFLSFVCDQPVPMGFSKWAHVGNMSDVTTEEILRYYGDDESTKVIAMYMEGMVDARRFFNTAEEVVKKKPLLILKVGRSDIAAEAAASHTGSLAGSDAIFDGAFDQVGVIRVDTIEELLDTSKALSMADIPKGNRVAILTEAGGPGVIGMDVIGNSNGLAQLAQFSEKTIEELRELLPPMAFIAHPNGYVDMTAGATDEQHAGALELLLRDENVDSVLLYSVPPTFLVPNDIAKIITEKMPLAKVLGKPVYSCFMAGDWIKEAHCMMEDAGIPTFELPQRTAKALVNAIARHDFMATHKEGKSDA